MKPDKKTFYFEYQIPVYKTFRVDIEKLANLLIEACSTGDYDTDLILEHFGDNVEFYLNKLGFPNDIEIEDYYIDYIYDGIYDDLLEALESKLQ